MQRGETKMRCNNLKGKAECGYYNFESGNCKLVECVYETREKRRVIRELNKMYSKFKKEVNKNDSKEKII